MHFRVAHTPDADDAFMFYAMLNRKIPLFFEVENIVEDIETLNIKAMSGIYEVTAISVYTYAFVSEIYRILSSGASVGDGYGPIVVAKERVDLNKALIAIPGKYTTASLLLKLSCKARTVEMRFDKILEAVKTEKVDAGLLIHEAQLNFEDYGLRKIFDLYEWWNSITGLPLPLGINVIKRDLHIKIQREFLKMMKMSVRYAIENVEEALNYAERFSRGLDRERLRKFVKMYVNENTLEMSRNVEKAIKVIFELAEQRGVVKKPFLDVLYDVG
ncbi:MAG: MqnA/MqnD/SBP family protein [Archaeoglobaceae archaeon]|nr:ABC transporter substrate-binding protein [Archaeoglobaceae archaeon]MDW7990315.1 MqnA/MqnD/SBP family protein [Archaeoglobaceae archaeon]